MNSRFAHPRRAWLACLIVCITAAALIFLLPLSIPVHFQPTISASYMAGFNNQAAAIAAAAIGVAVLIWSWQTHRGSPHSQPSPTGPSEAIGPVFASSIIIVMCAFYAVAGWLLAHSHLRYIADAGYFIEQISSHVESGRALYSGLEFAYGPLLFYPTILLHNALRCSWIAAYFVTLAFEQSLGIVLLAYVLNTWPIQGSDRRFGLVLLAVGSLNPLLGLNYTLFRFITAYAVLTFAAQRRTIATTMAVLGAGEILLLGISAELGVAFLAAALAFAGLRALKSGVAWLTIFAAPVLGAYVFLVTVGRAYFRMLSSFSRGTLNLPIAPYPHILVFLFAVLWVVPYALGYKLSSQEWDSTPLVACYAFGLGLLPATLGRCDPLHVFFDGAGVLMLSLVAIRLRPRVVRGAWISALLLLVGWQLWVTNRLFLARTADTVRLAVIPGLPARVQGLLLGGVARLDPDLALHLGPDNWDPDYHLDVQGLEHEVGKSPVATPLEITPVVEEALKRSGHYTYDYYAFEVDVFNASSEARKIKDLNQAHWALLPTAYAHPFIETPQNLNALQGFGLPYPIRHPIPFQSGKAFDENLAAQWTDVTELGPYTLYRRRGSSNAE